MAKGSRGKRGGSSAAAARPSRRAAPDGGTRASGHVVVLGAEGPQREAGADSQDRAAPPGNPLQGYIDEVSSTRITGWVWNPQLPDSSIALELVDGDTPLRRVTANQYRSDLRQAGIGDGRHAFLVPLGEEFLPSVRNVLHLRCAETGMEVPGSPVIIERGGVAAASLGLDEPYLPTPELDQRVADPLGEPAESDPFADTLRVKRRGSAKGVIPAVPRLVSGIAAEPNGATAL